MSVPVRFGRNQISTAVCVALFFLLLEGPAARQFN